MKKFLMALVVLAIASGPALAGPNANGVLMVHNTGLVYSDGGNPSPAPVCEAIVNTMPLGVSAADALIWKVYAVFPLTNSPRLKTLGWGYTLSTVNLGGIAVLHNGPQSDAVFFITSAGWAPATIGIAEVGMSFTDSVRVDPVNELWWFNGYGYAGAAGEPQMFSLVPNSQPGNQLFGDDTIPAITDPIAGYGSLGFGQPGYTYCPTGIVIGACCFPDGACTMLSAEDCQTTGGSFVGGECTPVLCPVVVYGACCVNNICNVMTPAACSGAGGTYFGDGSDCDPSPCPPVPTEKQSWGQIKNNYR